MGFFSEAVTKAVAKKVGEATLSEVCDYLTDTRSVDALANRSTADFILIIKKKHLSRKREFVVTDNAKQTRYFLTIDKECESARLYNALGNEIGVVRFEDQTGVDKICGLYLDGRKLGTVTSKFSFKVKMDLNFNGWHLDGTIVQRSFTVIDKHKNLVIKFNAAFSECDTYVLEYFNQENEILGLLLVMAVEIVLHSNN